MKRSLVVAALAAVVLWAPATSARRDSDEDHGSDHEGESEDHDGSKCSGDISRSSSYIKCTASVPVTLGSVGVTLPSAFCQSNDCYVFLNGLSTSSLSKCLSSYNVGGIAVSDAGGMKNCFTNGGVLASAPVVTATVTSMPQAGAPGPTSTTAHTSESGSIATTSGGSGQSTGTAAGSSSSTPSLVTQQPTTSTSVSSNAAENEADDTDGGDAGSGSSNRTSTKTKIVKKQKTTSSGAVVEELVVEEETGDATNSATTTGVKRSKSNGTGSQSASPSGDDGARERDGVGSYSIWMLVGGPIGGIVLMIAVFLYLRRRKSRQSAAKKLDISTDDGEYFPTLESNRSQADSVSILGASAISGRSLPSSRLAFWDDEIINAVRIPYEKLEISALLSRGGYGEVHRGMYRGQAVAIKSLLPERRKDMRQIEKFLAEVKLMAVLEHDHIVRFIGVAWDSLNELCVVSEFMASGDLRSLIAQYDDDDHDHPKGFTTDKIKIAMHIAHALTYMHSLQPAVLHRDLKSRNVLLDDELNAKLTDFGISRERVDGTMTIGVGSSLWMAPEVMTGGRYDEKADVFSFGVVMSELDTQTVPYAHALEPGTGRKLPDTVIVQMMSTGRIGVQFTHELDSPLAQLGRRCVALDPHDRPSAAEVQHRIHQLWRNPDDSL